MKIQHIIVDLPDGLPPLPSLSHGKRYMFRPDEAWTVAAWTDDRGDHPAGVSLRGPLLKRDGTLRKSGTGEWNTEEATQDGEPWPQVAHDVLDLLARAESLTHVTA